MKLAAYLWHTFKILWRKRSVSLADALITLTLFPCYLQLSPRSLSFHSSILPPFVRLSSPTLLLSCFPSIFSVLSFIYIRDEPKVKCDIWTSYLIVQDSDRFSSRVLSWAISDGAKLFAGTSLK